MDVKPKEAIRSPLQEVNLNLRTIKVSKRHLKSEQDEEAKLAAKRAKREQHQAEMERRKVSRHIATVNRRVVEKQDLQKEQRAHFIENFANITTKYTDFLKSKINTEQSGVFTTSTKKSNNNKGQLDVMKQLKYFQGELRPYQIDGLTWLTVLFENSINGILGDEMGLGKTIQVIALFCHLYERHVPGPYLVVAPLSTLGNWQDEFARFAPKLPVVRLQGNAEERYDQKAAIQRKYNLDGKKVAPIVICSYQGPLFESRFLATFKWQYIVVDEGHRIKNFDTKLSQELRALDSLNRSLLTGTPLQNNITELWTLFNFLMPDLFNNIHNFSSILQLEDMMDPNKLLGNEADTKIISTIHKVLAPFLLRREKKYVLQGLAAKKEMTIYCPMSPMQEALYRATLKKDYRFLTMTQEPSVSKKRSRNGSILRRSTRVAASTVDRSLSIRTLDGFNVKFSNMVKSKYYCKVRMQNLCMMLRQIVNHPYLIWTPLDEVKPGDYSMHVSEEMVLNSGKLMVLDKILPTLKKDGHKVLLFSGFVIVLDIVEEFLEMRGYKSLRLDGRTSFADRNTNIARFKEDDDVFVFLITTRAGGLGLNLTQADTVIFMDRDWNPMADAQAQDRCHRIGQTKPVVVYSLICKNTIDEHMVNRSQMKRRLEKVVLQEGKFSSLKKAKFDPQLSDQDLKDLEELLNDAGKTTQIQPDGMFYTAEELSHILDRNAFFGAQ